MQDAERLCYAGAMSTEPSQESTPQLPQQRGLAREFLDFIVHEKAWWMTPIIVVLLAMVAFILWAEASPVLPFIYTVF